MQEYNIRAVLEGGFDNVPSRSSTGAAGYDITSSEDREFNKKGVYTVKTGVFLEIPDGLCGILLPRSSLHKYGLRLANTIGLIDSDYRGEILLQIEYDGYNFITPGAPTILKKGTRMAQILFLETPNTLITIVDKLSSTERGRKGFGSTGGYHSDHEVF